MKFRVRPGKYILAVSGGVDSMALLDLLVKQPGVELVVAHFNHGIRPDSAKDEELVARRAKKLKLPYEVGYGRLGPQASEEAARLARYSFLEQVQAEYKARAIITAHHQDDVIETALLNLVRGTNYRGLVAMSLNPKIVRPLLKHSKEEIIDYAKARGLKWREDETNQNDKYMRNRLRQKMVNSLTLVEKQNLLKNIDKVAKIEVDLNNLIAKLSHNILNGQYVNRQKFASLPINLGNELVAYWLRQSGVAEFDETTVNRVNLALRTFKADTSCVIKGSTKLKIGKETAQFIQ